MRGDFDNIDELFGSELNDFAPAPPAQAWAGIESKLAAKKVKTPVVFYLRRVAAAVAILFAGVAVTLYLNSDKDQTKAVQMAATTETNSVLENSTSTNITQQTNELTKVEDVAVVENTSEQNTLISASQRNSNQQVEVEKEEPVAEDPIILASGTEGIVKDDIEVEEQEFVENDILIAMSAELSVQEKEEKIIYEPTEQEYSEAYKEFLAEFEEIDMPDDRKKWAVGGQAGPQYTYRQLSSNDVAQELIDEYNNSEDGLMAYAGGINIAYKPARRLSIQSGVYYSKMGHSSPATPIEPVDNIIPDGAYLPGQEYLLTNNSETNSDPAQLRVSSSFGEVKQNTISGDQAAEFKEQRVDNTFAEVSSVEQHLEYIEVPLMARYAIIDRKINFHLLGGVSTNFLVASPVYLDNGTHYTDAQNLNKINYSSTLGLGLGYKFSSFAISVEPQFKYYLNKVNTNASTDVHPYSFGVFTGVTYLF